MGSVGAASDPDACALVRIVQATTASFTDLFFRRAFVVQIERGGKSVTQADGSVLEGEAGDLFIFAANSFVTLRNRTWSGEDYVAVGALYPSRVIASVFTQRGPSSRRPAVQLLKARGPHRQTANAVQAIFRSLDERSGDIPDEVLQHRLQEPLVWLRSTGVEVPVQETFRPVVQLREMIEREPARSWRSSDAAAQLSVSESTLRRMLRQAGTTFSSVLKTTRLEHALSQLQTTQLSISEIALTSGFSSPSHFSESFKDRFRLTPREIRARE